MNLHLFRCCRSLISCLTLVAVVFGCLGSLSAVESAPLHLTSIAAARPIGFQRLSNELTGLMFTHIVPPSRSLTNQLLLDGAGVALADVDGDRRVDVFLGAANGGSQLWRNLGDWRFELMTERAFPDGISVLAGDVTGVVFGDLNGDRSPDLVINTHADGLRVLMNDGRGVFHVLSFAQSKARGGHSVAVADVDGDGWLDIYVCNYRQRALMDMPSARATFRTVNGVQTLATLDGRAASAPDLTNRFVVSSTGGLDELGEPDVLYRSLAGTNFVEVPWTQGAFLDEAGNRLHDPPRDWGLAAQFCDINDDGRLDLYVCNDFQTPDRLWFNESSPGQIRFRLAPTSVLRHTSLFSMGVDFADVNRDLRWDFMVLDMLSPDHFRRLTTLPGYRSVANNSGDRLSRPQYEANTLFLQRPDGSFADVACFAGVEATDWSWTPAFLDVDLDGWPDLLVSAGQERASRDLDLADRMKGFRRGGLRTDAQIFRERQKFSSHHAPLRAFRNHGLAGNGKVPRFEDVSAAWGFDFLGVSHGMALADLDGDGDLDVVVNHLGSPVGLYRNETVAPRISVRLKGRGPNTGAIGARLRFWWSTDAMPAPLAQSAQLTSGGRYLSSDDPSKTFGCPGPGKGVLEIRWPSGRISTHPIPRSNHRYEIDEAELSESSGSPRATEPKPKPRLRFEKIVLVVGLDGEVRDDFALQPSLPWRQSARSPRLAVSGILRENPALWIGGADSSMKEVWFSNTGATAPRPVGAIRSSAALVSWGENVIEASDAWAPKALGQSTLVLLNAQTGSEQAIPTRVRSVSSLAANAAVPTNGALLFVGGGAGAGDYPRSEPSELLRFDGVAFQSRVLTNLGLVTAALFANLDSGPEEELVTVSEWGAPRIFRCHGSFFEDWEVRVTIGGSAPLKLSGLTGLWQSVVAEDLDGDGRLDLVLGNWGLNSSYALFAGRPSDRDQSIRTLFLYHSVLEAGPRTCLEAYAGADGRMLPMSGLAEWSRHSPWASAQFPTYRAFAAATMDQILEGKSLVANRLECRWLSSLVLLNRGDHFEALPLPDLAQLGPIFSLAAADLDGDGRMDLYAAQGFFGHNFGRLRDDAGEGVFLLGRGDGTFMALPTSDAGFRLLGEQRTAILRDLNGDGRPDLVVGEHRGPVTVFLNQRSLSRQP